MMHRKKGALDYRQPIITRLRTYTTLGNIDMAVGHQSAPCVRSPQKRVVYVCVYV